MTHLPQFTLENPIFKGQILKKLRQHFSQSDLNAFCENAFTQFCKILEILFVHLNHGTDIIYYISNIIPSVFHE